ncbi:MAG: hypothetical protein IJC02_10340 [Lachnospiraceae bacterium]|nr:hypothetical protein [Lachnospiraceae bacterium]
MDLAVIDICKKTIRDSIENEVLHEMVPRLIYLDNMPRSVVVLPVPEEKCEERRKKIEEKGIKRIAGITRETKYRSLADIKKPENMESSCASQEYYAEYMNWKKGKKGSMEPPHMIMVNGENEYVAGYDVSVAIRRLGIEKEVCYLTENIRTVSQILLVHDYQYKNHEFVVGTTGYLIRYELSQPVVPGDDFIVRTKHGFRLVTVKKVLSLPVGCRVDDGEIIKHACMQDFEIFRERYETRSEG